MGDRQSGAGVLDLGLSLMMFFLFFFSLTLPVLSLVVPFIAC